MTDENAPQGADGPARSTEPPLADAVPPGPDADPNLRESLVRAAMHSDRSPGTVLAICHPLRMIKVPRQLFDALRQAGFDVQVVETQRERAKSIDGIRAALLEARSGGKPLDVLVFSGDGSLDHHVLVAAFSAFYPELVKTRAGEISLDGIDAEALARVPESIRQDFLSPLPSTAGMRPDDETIHKLWALRARIGALALKGASAARIARRAGLAQSDPMLRVAVAAAVLPERVVLRADGVDLAGLAAATEAHAFQGLYPFIRSIAVYPAGTAADNALYAGVPGWGYGRVAATLTRFSWLHGLRDRWERQTLAAFLDFFLRGSVVVPARFSVIAFDGAWNWLCSHAAGGPGGGRFFAADLEAKTGGVLGYLMRIPSVIIEEGLLNSTIIRLRSWRADGTPKLSTEGRMVEGLYTNRTFIAAVGSVPSTNPTSFAGQSSLILAPPLVWRDADGALNVAFSGLLSFAEAITKGVLARLMHGLGLGVGRLAGGGRFSMAQPENQVTLTEGEVLQLEYLNTEGKPKFVPTQISGDPYQATRMSVRVAWGPLPLLAATDSLLLGAAQRSLSRLRQAQSWQLASEFIGGLAVFRHDVGAQWDAELEAQTGLQAPPRTLPRGLEPIQRLLVKRWQALGTGTFVDTSEQGLQLGRRGRYAHTSDHAAHLVVLRERRSTLLVRQVRKASAGDAVYEARTTYRPSVGGWMVHERQLRVWRPDEPPAILHEARWFRDAAAFQLEAPQFFPFVKATPEQRVWTEVTEDPYVYEPPRRKA